MKNNPPKRSWEFGEDIAERPGAEYWSSMDEAKEAMGDAWVGVEKIVVEGNEETPKSNKMKRDSIPTEQQPEGAEVSGLEDELAANNLIKRYAEAWHLAREPVVTGDQYLSPDPFGHSTTDKPKSSRKKKSGKPKAKKPTDNVGNESLTLSRSTQYGSGFSDSNSNQHSKSDTSGRVVDQDGGDDGDDSDLRKEDDSYLGLEKRWNINQLKGGEPKVEIKHTWDPKTNVKFSNEKIAIQETNIRTKDDLNEGEFVDADEEEEGEILVGDNEELDEEKEVQGNDDVVVDGVDDVAGEEEEEEEWKEWDDYDYDEDDEEKQRLMKRDFEEALERLEKMFASIN